MSSPYEDIIHLPRPVSSHPRMSMTDRGAQFSPFAALTGYDAAIKETGRLTQQKICLDESEKLILDQKLQQLAPIVSSQPQISATYFVPDERKAGGQYVTVTARLKKIDLYEQMLLLDDQWISLDAITDIDSDLFSL